MAFLDRRLSKDGLASAEEHLADCSACRALVSNLAEDECRTQPLRPPTQTNVTADEGLDLGKRLLFAQARQRVGTVLCGRWTIDRILGIGGMAQVFAGTHRNGRRVAIKMLRAELAVDPALVRRFVREGYIANRIEHPGTVAILDDDVTDDGLPFLVMELLEGKTLRAHSAPDGLEIEAALRITDELLAAVGAAHALGIVHRDLKPDNVFVTNEGRVKVLDYGIARLHELKRDEGVHTEVGVTLGTIGYMPPEQARGETELVDARTDVWALAATVFALFTGQPVQQGTTIEKRMVAAMTLPVEPTCTLSPKIPPAIGHVLDVALAFDRADRFADATELRDALGRAATALPMRSRAGAAPAARASVQTGAPRGTSRRGRPVALAVAGFGVAVSLVFAVAFARIRVGPRESVAASVAPAASGGPAAESAPPPATSATLQEPGAASALGPSARSSPKSSISSPPRSKSPVVRVVPGARPSATPPTAPSESAAVDPLAPRR